MTRLATWGDIGAPALITSSKDSINRAGGLLAQGPGSTGGQRPSKIRSSSSQIVKTMSRSCGQRSLSTRIPSTPGIPGSRISII